MFKNEDELMEKCKELLHMKGIRPKYFSFLFNFAKEDTDNYDDIYNNFDNIVKIVKIKHLA